MKCSFCGHEFDEAKAANSCGGCLFLSGCELVRCPRCSYEMPKEPGWFKRWKNRRQGKQTAESAGLLLGRCLPLPNLELNRKAQVFDIRVRDRVTLHKMIALSLLPGTELTLIQKFPSYVFKVGRSQFTIDRQLAESVYVRIC